MTLTRSLRTLGLLAASATAAASLVLAPACSDTAGNKGTPATGTPVEAGSDADTFTSSEELQVPVAAGRVYVKLASPPAIVTPADPKTDKGWDLAFEGLDVFTNSGPSGGGLGASFGPLDPIVFIDDKVPATPFLAADTTGGAFLRWWFYGGSAASHALFTRFHVYGVQDGAKQYKVQVLNYYGLRDGTSVAALYKVRWAEITAQGVGATQEAVDLDGTADQSKADGKQECLDLGTGTRMLLTSAEARASSAWHLCFRRENVSVNGEVGGPRGVGAVDLDAANSPNETLSQVVDKTPESELAHFDAVNAASLAGQPFRGDRIVSGFGTLWLERGVTPPAPSKTAWVVRGADNTSMYLVGFARFDGATATSPGTVVMRVKSVK
jgi:hypothetical protein